MEKGGKRKRESAAEQGVAGEAQTLCVRMIYFLIDGVSKDLYRALVPL